MVGAKPQASRVARLRPGGSMRHTRLTTALPAADLEHWVSGYWALQWDLPPGARESVACSAEPAATLTVEHGSSSRADTHGPGVFLTGSSTTLRETILYDSGSAFGISFRPGAVASLSGRSSKLIRDALLPAERVFPTAHDLADLQAEASSCAARADAYVRSLRPEPDPQYDLVQELVADVIRDSGVTTVEQVLSRYSVPSRTLHRLLSHYLGVSPKWLITHCRLLDAVHLLDTGYAGTPGDLAAELGWDDEERFVAAFTELTGVSPQAHRDGRSPFANG